MTRIDLLNMGAFSRTAKNFVFYKANFEGIVVLSPKNLTQ